MIYLSVVTKPENSYKRLRNWWTGVSGVIVLATAIDVTVVEMNSSIFSKSQAGKKVDRLEKNAR
jgi:hypothetical protein